MMKRLKQPRILIWQYEVFKLAEKLIAILILAILVCWSILFVQACEISLVNDGKSGMVVNHLTQTQGINLFYNIMKKSAGSLAGLGVFTLITVLDRKIVENNMRNSLTQATTLTKLVTSTGQVVVLPFLKANSPWRRQTLAYKKVKRAPIGKLVLDSKLDRQTRKKKQHASRDQQKQERQRRLAKLASNEVMVAPITIATWFGTFTVVPNDVSVS